MNATVFTRFSILELWIWVAIAAVFAIAVIAILAYHFSYDEKNEDPKARRKNITSLRESAVVASMLFMAVYIMLVAGSGQYREYSWIFGIILVLIGMAIMAAINVVCSLVTGRIWRKAQKARVANRRERKRLEGERRFYKLIANTSLPADLNREL